MQVVLRLISVLGLAVLALLLGAMRIDPVVVPAQVSAPPAIETQPLKQLSRAGSGSWSGQHSAG